MATSCYDNMSNYLNFNDIDGIYTYTYAPEKSENCLACSTVPQAVNIEDPNTTTLEDLIKILCESPKYQMKQPGITTMIDGKNKTLYISTVKSIEERTRSNLTQSLGELGLKDGQPIMVSDQTSPNTITLVLKYNSNEVEMN
ncbi:hypothetical protein DOY81_011480 [Sarcophaga bullata]|nr:hypothetical protein DOY81_011480 [Sarcophaga bullata]